MKKTYLAIMMLCLSAIPVSAQTGGGTADPFQALQFLEGTWDANVQNNAAVTLSGRYTFQLELGGHILARHSSSDPNCKAPESFDCKHGDLLYVYSDAPGTPLKAIYFDNEGHVIHYDVNTAGANSVVFLSPAGQGPRFKLSYELKGNVMTGKFQMQPPGQEEWRTYLEWSGAKK